MEEQKTSLQKSPLMWWIIGGSVLIILIVAVVIFLIGRPAEAPTSETNLMQYNNTGANVTANTTDSPSQTSGTASWQWNGTTWAALGTPPTCSDPLGLVSPVDISKARAVLYPGQTRGGNYKPHGGFLFNGKNEDIAVTAPMDATVVKGSRYIEQGEVQYLLFFVNSCGIAYRFDHLLTLSPVMQKLADTLPAAQVDNSQTTNFAPGATVKKGDVIATAVGFKKNSNVSVDFGVYDLRKTNAASQNAAYASAQGTFKETTFYATCWLDLLPAAQSSLVKALPGGDQTAGKTSDYCK